MPNGAQNLGMQLGQLIFGRPDDGRSYVQGQAAGALVDDRMASARRARAAAMIDEDRLGAREGVTPDALTKAGYAPNQSPLLGAILCSNTNLDLRNLGALQAPTAGQALTDAAAAVNLGDMARGNNLLALAGGKPIQTTKVDGSGQVINPYGDPGQQVNLTALGDALVREKGASAANKNAMAGVHRKNGKPDAKPTVNMAPLVDMFTHIFSGDAGGAPAAAAPGQPAAAVEPRRAPDGNLYVPDPNRPGKWLRVDG